MEKQDRGSQEVEELDIEAQHREHDPQPKKKLAVEGWEFKSLYDEIRTIWLPLFNEKFKLGLDVASIPISIEKLPRKVQGSYLNGYNGRGEWGEIKLNAIYAEEKWDFLGSLLHEMVHRWQYTHGHPSDRRKHNQEWIDKMRGCGIVANKRGEHTYLPDGEFIFLMKEKSIEVADDLIPSYVAEQANTPKKSRSPKVDEAKVKSLENEVKDLKKENETLKKEVIELRHEKEELIQKFADLESETTTRVKSDEELQGDLQKKIQKKFPPVEEAFPWMYKNLNGKFNEEIPGMP